LRNTSPTCVTRSRQKTFPQKRTQRAGTHQPLRVRADQPRRDPRDAALPLRVDGSEREVPGVDREVGGAKGDRNRRLRVARYDERAARVFLRSGDGLVDRARVGGRGDDERRACTGSNVVSGCDAGGASECIPVSRMAVRPLKLSFWPPTEIEGIFASQKPIGLTLERTWSDAASNLVCEWDEALTA